MEDVSFSDCLSEHPEAAARLEHHRRIVAGVAAQARALYDCGTPYRVYHGSSNTTRPTDSHAPPPAVLDISALDEVVHVDVAAQRAVVEPNVAMDRLVAAVQAASGGRLVPPVVMEFPGITAGGGFSGTGGESASFRHGFFDETVTRIEMVLADGTVVEAGRDGGTRPDLFSGAAGAVGSLGTVTLLAIRLVAARQWVRTTYRRTRSVADTVAGVRAAVQDGLGDDDHDNDHSKKQRLDFVDGILFSLTHGVVVTGVLTDDKPADVAPQTFSDPWDPWFYLHARAQTSAADAATDYIPLAEYLFRYDRGGFWVGRYSFLYFFMVPFARWTRWLFDDVLHTRMMYRAMRAGGGAHSFVLQDLAVPFGRAGELVDYAAAEFGIWPLWLCPLRRRPGPTFHPAVTSSEAGAGVDATHVLNIGLWGLGPLNPAVFVAKNRALEAKLTALGGRKWLYASTFFAEDDFWRLYGGRAWYDALRARYRAHGTLPSVFDKVQVRASSAAALPWRETLKLIWPLGGVLGIWKSWQTKDYRLHRHATWRYKEKRD